MAVSIPTGMTSGHSKTGKTAGIFLLRRLQVQAAYLQTLLRKLLFTAKPVLQIHPRMDGPFIERHTRHLLHDERPPGPVGYEHP